MSSAAQSWKPSAAITYQTGADGRRLLGSAHPLDGKAGEDDALIVVRLEEAADRSIRQAHRNTIGKPAGPKLPLDRPRGAVVGAEVDGAVVALRAVGSRMQQPAVAGGIVERVAEDAGH